MNSGKIIGIILIAISIWLGYMGIIKISNNNKSVEVLNLEVDVSNKSGKEQGYMYLGAAVLLFVGGIYSLNKK